MKNEKQDEGFTAIELLLVVVVLIILGVIGWKIYSYQSHNESADTTSDSWTGKGSNNKWSDAANWTKGVPANGDNLIFNVSALKPAPCEQGSPTVSDEINDDITDLHINNIAINAPPYSSTSMNCAGYDIIGNPFSLAGGITKTGSSISEIKQAITLTSNQAFTGGDISTGTLNISSYHLNLSGVQPGEIVGEGIIEVSGGSVFQTDSPNFSGNVIIDNAVEAQLYAYTSSTIHPLGTATITIKDGGTLLIFGNNNDNSFTYTMANPIAIAGQGTLSDPGYPYDSENNPYEGAIEIQLYKLNLTGKLTLDGNTTLGAYTAADGPTPSSAIINVTGGFTSNGYTLNSSSVGVPLSINY